MIARRRTFNATYLLFWTWLTSCIFIAYQLFTHRAYLYCDTPWDLHNSLSSGSIMVGDYARWWGHFPRYWPLILHYGLGVTDILILFSSYGLSVVAFPVVCGLLCWHLVRKSNPALILLPIWSHLFAFAESYIYSYTEPHFALAAFWPLVFTLTTNYQGVLRSFLILFLGLFPAFSYENSTFFFTPVITWIIFASESKHNVASWEKVYLATTSVIGFAMSAHSLVGFRSTLSPSAIALLLGFEWVYKQPTIWLAIPVVSLLMLTVHLRKEVKALTGAALVFITLKAWLVFTAHEKIYDAFYFWHFRSLLYAVPVVLFLGLPKALKQITQERLTRVSHLSILYLLVMTGLVSAQIRDWDGYLNTFYSQLEKGGLIRDAETPFYPAESRTGSLSYHCSIASASLSLFLQAMDGKPVTSIVLNGYDDNVTPWDPRGDWKIPIAHLGIPIDPKLEEYIERGPHKKLFGPAPAL